MKQPDQIKKLLELIQKHPKLPIVPMVWGELVSGDEYRRWMGSWGVGWVLGEMPILPNISSATMESISTMKMIDRNVWKIPVYASICLKRTSKQMRKN